MHIFVIFLEFILNLREVLDVYISLVNATYNIKINWVSRCCKQRLLGFLGVPTNGLGVAGSRRRTGRRNALYAVVCGYRFHYFIFRAPSSAGVRHAILAPWCFIYSLPRVTSSLPFYLSWLRWWILFRATLTIAPISSSPHIPLVPSCTLTYLLLHLSCENENVREIGHTNNTM